MRFLESGEAPGQGNLLLPEVKAPRKVAVKKAALKVKAAPKKKAVPVKKKAAKKKAAVKKKKKSVAAKRKK